ncbi:MAG: hypothetical protein HC918_13315 [Oscillatoriales cyanobacterium SM2_1_8]|nr:hypothetical protein [Oscillatoriales cyanobacterium SM2_1_8]
MPAPVFDLPPQLGDRLGVEGGRLDDDGGGPVRLPSELDHGAPSRQLG